MARQREPQARCELALHHRLLNQVDAGIEPALRRCKVPTRIVWGMADDIFAKESPDYLDRLLPNSRGVRRLPKAKLFWPEEYPDVVAEEARKLWDV